MAAGFFIIFLISSLTAVAFAYNGEKNTGENPQRKFSPDNHKNILPTQKQSPFYGRGSDRRNQNLLASSNADTDSDTGIESYNPSTGWHTIHDAEIVNYRGARKVITDESFKVCCIKSEKTKNDSISVEIRFNQEINPKSFSSSNLKINGKSVNNDVKFSFSRKGDSVKIQIPSQSESFSLSLVNIQTFDGEEIQEIQLGKISAD